MKISAGESAIKSLEIEGVEYAFGILGSYLLDLFDLVGRSSQINYVGTRHEEHAIHMANGYGRAADGKIAITLAQTGSGLANSMHGLANAWRAKTPLLCMSGGLPSREIDGDNRHEIDQLAMTRPVTKWSARVARGDRFPEYLQRAFRVMRTPPFGPVFLEVPEDILTETFDWEPPSDTHRYRASYQSMVDAEAIGVVADLVAAAKRPVFIVGLGGENPQAWQELAAISDSQQIALTASFSHNSAIPRSALAVGTISRMGSRAAMQLVGESDLVIVVGSRLSPATTAPVYGFEYWPENAKIVHVDSDPLQIGRHRHCDVGIAADAVKFLTALRERLAVDEAPDRSQWRSRILAAKAEWLDERSKATEPEYVEDDKSLNIAAVYGEVARQFSDEGMIVTDVGWSTSFGFKMVDPGRPKGLIYAGSMAGLGFSLGGAMGVKLARPDRQVVAMVGDGAFTMALPALITAVEYKIPLRIVVVDNKAWGAEKSHQMYWFEENYVGANLEHDIVAMSAGVGAKAVRVGSIEELGHELANEPEDGPTVIVAPAHTNDIGNRAVKKPTRYLYT